MGAVKPQIPKEKLVSVATGSGKHTSVHSYEKPELSKTKRSREKKLNGGRHNKKTEWSGSFVYNEQLECEDC